MSLKLLVVYHQMPTTIPPLPTPQTESIAQTRRTTPSVQGGCMIEVRWPTEWCLWTASFLLEHKYTLVFRLSRATAVCERLPDPFTAPSPRRYQTAYSSFTRRPTGDSSPCPLPHKAGNYLTIMRTRHTCTDVASCTPVPLLMNWVRANSDSLPRGTAISAAKHSPYSPGGFVLQFHTSAETSQSKHELKLRGKSLTLSTRLPAWCELRQKMGLRLILSLELALSSPLVIIIQLALCSRSNRPTP